MNEPPNSAGDEIQLPRGERVDQLRNLIETLRIADEVANRGYLITSDGDKVSNPKHFKKHYRRLRKAQKSLSRKQKGSKNREKARIKVAKIHARITDSRKDHLHKLTTQLVRENQTIVVENLAVKNMVKNPKLSQAISDVSWGEITRQLAYKCRWYGRNYIGSISFMQVSNYTYP